MATLREQMQNLAEDIQRLRRQRQERQTKRQKDWQRNQSSHHRARQADCDSFHAEMQLASQSRLAFIRGLRQSISRTMNNYRAQRILHASHRKQRAKHATKVLRRNLLQSLQEHQHRRARERSLLQRTQLKTRHDIKLQVQQIRGEVHKLLDGLSQDLQMARAAWAQTSSVNPSPLLPKNPSRLPK